jgi:hypothetical protein
MIECIFIMIIKCSFIMIIKYRFIMITKCICILIMQDNHTGQFPVRGDRV